MLQRKEEEEAELRRLEAEAAAEAEAEAERIRQEEEEQLVSSLTAFFFIFSDFLHPRRTYKGMITLTARLGT